MAGLDMPSSEFEVITAKSSHRPPWLVGSAAALIALLLAGGWWWATNAEDTPAVESPVFLLPTGDGVRVVGADLLTEIDPGDTWHTTMFVDGYSVQTFPSSTTNPVIDAGSEPASVKGQPAFWTIEERGRGLDRYEVLTWEPVPGVVAIVFHATRNVDREDLLAVAEQLTQVDQPTWLEATSATIRERRTG